VDLPYQTLGGSAFPDPDKWDDPALQQASFPGWQDETVISLGYRESKTYYYGNRAFVTSRVRETAWLSIYYYSPDGSCHLALPLARTAPQQQISYSMQLPLAEDGMTRVVFWSSLPSQSLIEQLALQTLPGPAYATVLYQAWFPRTNHEESGLPYEPLQYRLYETAPSFAMTDVPAARTQLSSDYVAYSKDIFVEFDGRRSLGTDEWGSRGEWVLAWGHVLRLEIYLPERPVFTNAMLRLYMEQSIMYSGGEGEGLLLKVNDRNVHSTMQSGAISVYPKHVDYELGQYMYPGLNVIELSMDAFSTRDWLLQTAEVWIR
jgi:hypothetical protein